MAYYLLLLQKFQLGTNGQFVVTTFGDLLSIIINRNLKIGFILKILLLFTGSLKRRSDPQSDVKQKGNRKEVQRYTDWTVAQKPDYSKVLCFCFSCPCFKRMTNVLVYNKMINLSNNSGVMYLLFRDQYG